MKNRISIIIALALILLSPSAAHALCVNPDGVAGDQVYNGLHKAMQYCDGDGWVAMATRTDSTLWLKKDGNLYFNSGNVGIGTATPLYKLDVYGTARVTGGFYLTGLAAAGIVTNSASGLLQTTAILPVTLGGTGSNGYSDSSVIFAKSGVLTQDNSKFYWDDTNYRLGINAGAPLYNLDVNGNARITSTVNLTNFTTAGVVTNNAAGLLQSKTALDIQYGGTNNSAAYTLGSVIFSNGASLIQDNSKFYWDDTNYRLGINKSSPSYTLDVNGNAKVATSLVVNNNLMGSNGNGDLELGLASGTGTSTIGITPFIDFHYGSGTAEDYNVRIINDANGRLSNLAATAYFNGNLGIGTTSPATSVQVSKGDSSYTLYGPNTTWSGYLYTGSGPSIISAGRAQVISTNGNLHLDSGTTSNIFLNNYAQTNTFINPLGGSVGVGNTAPNYKLDVSGDIYANGGWMRVSGNQGLYFQSYGGGWYMTDSTWIRAYNGKSVYAAAEIATDSDFSGPIFYDRNDPTYYMDPNSTSNINALRMVGNATINSATPTIYLQDSDNRSAMIHVNGNLFYILRGDGTNSTSWAAYNGYWPLTLNLENNDATFGGSIIAPIMYDRDNSGYYSDPSGTSRTNVIVTNSIGVNTAPSYPLHVYNSGATTGTVYSTYSNAINTTSTGAAVGVQGTATASSGTCASVFLWFCASGYSPSNSYGIYGSAATTSSSWSNAYGVYGVAGGATNTYGVYGTASTGVYGSGTSIGVYGYTASGSYGVYGYNGGSNYGGYFSSSSGTGIYTNSCSGCSVLAEMVKVAKTPENGSVMCVDRKSGLVDICAEDKSSRIKGVAQKFAEQVLRSGCSLTEEQDKSKAKNGIEIGVINVDRVLNKPECKGWYPIALTGLSEKTNVVCHTPKGKPIEYGDTLVTSSKSGFMRPVDEDENIRANQIAGQADTICAEGKETDIIQVWLK